MYMYLCVWCPRGYGGALDPLGLELQCSEYWEASLEVLQTHKYSHPPSPSSSKMEGGGQSHSTIQVCIG